MDDGTAVTGVDVIAEASRLPPEVRAKSLADPAQVAQAAYSLLARRALAAEAEQAGLDRDPKVAAQLRLARERVLAEARLASLQETKRPDRAALEALARTEYRVNPGVFETPEQIRVRHILIDSRSCNAEERIKELLEQARAPGADFAALAETHSQDPGSAKRGGDLGFFTRGKMAHDFDNAAFALKTPGEISDVVRSDFGLHIIKLEERKPAQVPPFEKVKDQLVEQIAQRDANSRQSLLVEELSKRMKADKAAIESFAARNH